MMVDVQDRGNGSVWTTRVGQILSVTVQTRVTRGPHYSCGQKILRKQFNYSTYQYFVVKSYHIQYSTVLKSASLLYCKVAGRCPATTTPPAVRVTTPCTSGISNRQVVSACPTSSSRVGGTPHTCLSASLPPCVVGNNTFLLLDPLLFTMQY